MPAKHPARKPTTRPSHKKPATRPKTTSRAAKQSAKKPVAAPSTDPREVKRLRAQLAKLVPAEFAASQELRSWMAEDGHKTRADEPIASALGKPCSESEIHSIESFYGRPLPASYVAYLSLYGSGKKRFGSPIGCPDEVGMALGALESLSDLFDEFGDDNPITDGVIPFYIHMDSRDSVLIMPRKRGGTEVVTYDRITEKERFPDLVAYYRHEIQVTRSCIADYVKRDKERAKGAIQTVRQAIEAVLAAKPLNKKGFKEVVERLQGHLPEGHLPSPAVLQDLADGPESKRFLAAVLAINLPDVVLMSLAYDAVELLQPENRRAGNVEKALPIVEILFEIVRRNPKRPAGKKYELFLRRVNAALLHTFMLEERALTGRLAELAAPYARDDLYIPHNAACAFAVNERYDEALEMCRVAVASKYPYKEKLRTDKDLGALLRRPDFKALFA